MHTKKKLSFDDAKIDIPPPVHDRHRIIVCKKFGFTLRTFYFSIFDNPSKGRIVSLMRFKSCFKC